MSSKWTIYLALFLSGASGLIYEVVWARQFGLVMGNTAYALSTVISAFLAGLAAGAAVGGWWSARREPTLVHYAILEACIGGFAVVMPLLLSIASPALGWAYRSFGDDFATYGLFQFAISAALILIPTFGMGATLPVLAAVLSKEMKDVTRVTARVYGVNTLGASFGIATAGFVLLPAFGMTITLFSAAVGNLLAAGLAFWIHRRGEAHLNLTRRHSTPIGANDTWPVPPRVLVIVVYALSGFASLVLQVGWSRVVGLSIGSTHRGFTLTLLTFIVGIGIGSLLAPRIRSRDPVRASFELLCMITVSSLLSIPWLSSLPIEVIELSAMSGLARDLSELFVVWRTIAVPTLGMGAMLPIITRLMDLDSSAGATWGAGRSLGTVYAANTLGSIAGAFIAGFVLLPTLGMRDTILLSAALSGVAALVFVLHAFKKIAVQLEAVVFATFALLVLILMPLEDWSPELLTSGSFIIGEDIYELADGDLDRDRVIGVLRSNMGEMIDVREGVAGVVSIRRRADQLLLQSNGVTDAASSSVVQEQLAHFPLLIHGGPERALIIGLGGGGTIASALLHPLESVDCVEISAEVRDAAEQHFSVFMQPVMSDPRVKVRIGDGRNHLQHSGKMYDVIISQPSVPWLAGSAGLFTAEAFQAMRDHLEPEGIACSWFLGSGDDGQVVSSVLRTWQSVFPNCTLISTDALGSYLLIGQLDDERKLPAINIERGLAKQGVREALHKLGITEVADVIGRVVLGPPGIFAASRHALLNTDDRAYIEYHAAERLLRVTEAAFLDARLRRASLRRSPHVDYRLETPAASKRLRTRLNDYHRAEELLLQAEVVRGAQGIDQNFRTLLRQIGLLVPSHPYYRAFAQ